MFCTLGYCSNESVNAGSQGNYTFRKTFVSETVNVRCLEGQTNKILNRTCLRGASENSSAHWSSLNLESCSEVKTKNLVELSKVCG